jgi:hypothetical protein
MRLIGDFADFVDELTATPPAKACSHFWVDPDDAPIERASYSPVIGEKRREMKHGRTYRCLNCGKTIESPPA